MRLILIALVAFGQTTPQALYQQAVEQFRAGRVAESANSFDQLARAVPQQAPDLWQRGIALYYAGRFADCRAQFESHRAVNPDDVENAAWHFLCVARQTSTAKARELLLPVGPDPRRPMKEVLEMFRGKLTPDQVIAAAGSSDDALFYAHLYVGLYNEALAKPGETLRHIRIAAQDRFQAMGYMHMVARVHLRLLESK
jgi:lipoprotein NlpI